MRTCSIALCSLVVLSRICGDASAARFPQQRPTCANVTGEEGPHGTFTMRISRPEGLSRSERRQVRRAEAAEVVPSCDDGARLGSSRIPVGSMAVALSFFGDVTCGLRDGAWQLQNARDVRRAALTYAVQVQALPSLGSVHQGVRVTLTLKWRYFLADEDADSTFHFTREVEIGPRGQIAVRDIICGWEAA
jgi:hypothetical protein